MVGPEISAKFLYLISVLLISITFDKISVPSMNIILSCAWVEIVKEKQHKVIMKIFINLRLNEWNYKVLIFSAIKTKN